MVAGIDVDGSVNLGSPGAPTDRACETNETQDALRANSGSHSGSLNHSLRV